MKYHSDSSFLIGHSHFNNGEPCQDFALNGKLGSEGAYTILCDGSSCGSDKDLTTLAESEWPPFYTGVGASVLALATREAMKDDYGVSANASGLNPHAIAMRQKSVIASARATLGLRVKDMFATCLYAAVDDNGALVHVVGDGVVAFGMRDGTTRLHHYNWEGSMPAYPAYAIDDFAGFTKEHGGSDAERLTEEICDDTAEGFKNVESRKIKVKDGVRGVTTIITPEQLQQIELIAIFSDGVCSVEGKDWKNSVIQLLSFPCTANEFVKRQLKFFVKDEVRAKKKGPFDDISMGVIHITH